MENVRRKSFAHPFYWLATLALVVAILSRTQAVVVPLALAVLIAFALTPPVRILERRLGHALAVTVVVLAALVTVASFGYLIERQMVQLSTQLSRYSDSIRHKLAVFRGDGDRGLAGLSRTVDQLAQELDRAPPVKSAAPVRVVPEQATVLERFDDTVAPVLRPVADVVVVVVLVIFLLLRRNDLRDRFVRLAGRRNVSLTTRTLDDAGQRISQFLIVQSAINAGFGVAVSLALLLIGVPFAPLWGFLAAVLRFVPFVGTMLGMVFPAALAFALTDGWWSTVATVAVFLGLDGIVAYAVEPLVIGHRTGVSSLAMIVMAVFWTWLWGPVGLVLSTPLTVCLAVLGRQIHRLEFLGVLLGDEPPLETEITFYQRLLAGDEDEAGQILEKRLREQPREQAFDTVIVPALHIAEHDCARGEIEDNDHAEVLATVRALVTQNGDTAARPDDASHKGERRAPRRVLGVPARAGADELVWNMLASLLDRSKFAIDSLGPGTLVSEVIAEVEKNPPDLFCITSVAPGGVNHLRHLCRRLESARAQVRILILRLDPGISRPLPLGEPVAVTHSFVEAIARADQLLSLSRRETPPSPAEAAG